MHIHWVPVSQWYLYLLYFKQGWTNWRFGLVLTSYNIFSSFGFGLWHVQVECVPSYPALVPLEVVNCHHQVLKLEPLEMWYHRDLVLVMGSLVFITVLVLTIILLFISLGRLWVMFLSVFETLVIVYGAWSGWIFPISNGIMQLVMNIFFCVGVIGFGKYQLCYILCCSIFFVFKWHTFNCEVLWKIHCVNNLFFPFLFMWCTLHSV